MAEEEKQINLEDSLLDISYYDIINLFMSLAKVQYKILHQEITSKNKKQIFNYCLSSNDKKPAYERYFTMNNYFLENMLNITHYIDKIEKYVLKNIDDTNNEELFVVFLNEIANVEILIIDGFKSEELIFNSGKIGANLYIPNYNPNAIEEAKEKVDALYFEIIEKYGKKGKRRIK